MAERGRPSIFTEELAARICERLALGESLRKICRDEDMPAESTVRLWAADINHPISAQYTKAREIGYLGMGDELLEIADTPMEGVTVTTKLSKDGDMYDETKRGDMIEHRKLQVDARKWTLARMLPKVSGDRLSHEVGGVGGGPLVVTWQPPSE